MIYYQFVNTEYLYDIFVRTKNGLEGSNKITCLQPKIKIYTGKNQDIKINPIKNE